MEDVPDAADDLHLDLLQLVPLHPLLRLHDLLRGGADLVPEGRSLVLVGCVVQLLQLVFDGLPLLEAVQALLDRLYADKSLCDIRDLVRVEREPKEVEFTNTIPGQCLRRCRYNVIMMLSKWTFFANFGTITTLPLLLYSNL